MKYEGKAWLNGGWVDREIQMQDRPPKVKKKKISGIYAIECPSLRIVYVGQSLNIHSRWSQHKHVLRRGNCEIKKMQDAWNQYSDSFVFKILEETCDEMRVKEQKYASEYVVNGYDLWNSYFILNPTSMVFSDDFKPLFLKIIKLHAKGRLNISNLEQQLDTL